MQKLKINGGRRLVGEVRASGAKNAALPIIAAGLLTTDEVILHNVPDLADVRTMGKLLRGMGVVCERLDESSVRINASAVTSTEAPYELVKTMRASVLTLGPLVARFGAARVSLPGGCSIGARPVDQHIKALKLMGAAVDIDHGYMNAKSRRLKGARIVTDMVTVTGTENIMMVVIEGVERLHGCEHSVIADRIETGTFLCAALATRGDILVTHADPASLEAVIGKLREAGGVIDTGSDWIRARIDARPRAVDVRTVPHPGFPTDMQAQFMALDAVAEGSGRIVETIFENRFMHVPELQRMGADIHVDGHTAVVRGVEQLEGASVMATDLRASASLVIAGLAAQGETVIDRIYHLDRGYEHIETKLSALGADIMRVS